LRGAELVKSISHPQHSGTSGHDLDIPALERAFRYTNPRLVLEMKITTVPTTDSEIAKKETSWRRMALRVDTRGFWRLRKMMQYQSRRNIWVNLGKRMD